MHEISEIPTNVDMTSIKLQKLQLIYMDMTCAIKLKNTVYWCPFSCMECIFFNSPYLSLLTPHKNHENLSSKTYNKTKVIHQHTSPSTTQQNHLEDMFAPCLKHNTTCTSTPVLN
jgi:hypothetical protein